MHHEWYREGFTVSTDPSRLDVEAVHAYLTNSYWAQGVSLERVRESIAGSLCFGLYHDREQIGFARVISDRATLAYIADVYVLEPWRGRGLSKWLMECILGHPGLQGLRRWLLATRDAHGLYARYGFTPLQAPERWMQMRPKDARAGG